MLKINLALGIQKSINGFFEITKTKGTADVDLKWEFMEDMCLKAIGRYTNIHYSSESSVDVFYENPLKRFYFLKAGGDIRIDKLWEAGSNVTLKLPPTNSIGIEGHFKVPDDNKETHSLLGNLEYTKNFRKIDYLLKYRTTYSLKKYGSWGQVQTEDPKNLSGDVEVEWNSKRYRNFANLKRSNTSFNLIYKLKTPKFTDKQFIMTEIKYDLQGDHHNLTCEAFYPEDRSVAYGTVDYKELANMNGMFNVTLPHKSLNYAGAYFTTQTNAAVYNRYIKVFWDGDNAILDSKCDIKSGVTLLDRYMKGKLIVELPLATRHLALVDYKYDKKMQVSDGHATINYNGGKVLEAKYDCLSESRAGYDKDTIHVELHSKMIPVGADYVHSHQYDVPREGYNTPSSDNKFLHLYNLQNRSKFDVTGELSTRTTWTGQEYILTAAHTNRSVKLWTDYDMLDMEYKQHSRLELSPSTWIEYDLNLINRTVDDLFDVQEVVINVFHPRRNFIAQGFYNISDTIVSTDLSVVWDKDNKTVQAGLDWKRTTRHREQLLFQIKHPSFEKDVSFFSEYGYNKSSIDGQLLVDYSLNPDQKLTLGGKVTDNSNSITYNYTYNVWAEHKETNLNLNSRGDFYWNPHGVGTEQTTNYQRSYLPLSTAQTLAKIDFDDNEIELKKDSLAAGLSYFWGRYGGVFPVYTANMSAVHGTNNTSGEFYLNLWKKLLYLHVNMTEDGSQSLHMYGLIPDARSVTFDIWRDYEDKRVSDVSYYLRLNHSRLIMSTLRWRPELTGDVQSGIRGHILQLYLDALEAINNTKQYIRAETADAINGVWIDSKPKIQQFLIDLRNLAVIEEDIEQLKIFLNNSYYANDFYIKDITNITVTMFDELALKSQLQTFPKIVQEIWSVMGESGQKLKKSVLWVIEKIKTYYKSTTDFIHGLLNGDPVEHISRGLEKLVEKYDAFIKSVHVTILQYMESLWSQTYALIVEHWHKTLAAIEPTFLKFIHYLESMLWNTGKEFLDFLYLRKNEIMESPYFVKFTEFSHDLDKFYKDITGNNTVASIYKYANIGWKFLKEKYLHSIPFGQELAAIVNEIWTELKQIGNIPTVRYVLDKLHETYESAKYYYNRFDVEDKIHRLITLVYTKLSEMSITALQVENRHREAKTKFIFEPNDGIMLLEQKTPYVLACLQRDTEEIPEIKSFFDLQSQFESSQSSFWNLYYDYKPFVDPSEWLPPFQGHAMLVGSKYYVTFDKRYYDFRGSCTYLLATDFSDRNFTLLVSYDDKGDTNQLILLLDKTVVKINSFTGVVEIGDSGTDQLPAQILDVYLYRVSDIVTVQSASGFTLECNMKFHICLFQVSGWYFGKTAGLWGTLNNEPYDDFLMSTKVRANITDLDEFGNSWALDKSCRSKSSKPVASPRREIPQEILALCEEFFTSKVSQLSRCFPRIPKDSFLSMCLNSASEQEACMSAVSYINLCSYANTPMRIPDTCVKCNLLNGTEIQEGDFIRLQGGSVPKTADIVFIVEAKKCNEDLKTRKNLETVLELLEKELNELNITNNRYSLVVFGGDGVYDLPRSVIIKGKTFTDSKSFMKYFDDIPMGNGNEDIFNALVFAYNLIYRPGVSKNFILIPCSDCNKDNMEHDYFTIHQLLSESAVSLHILMNEHFTMQKEREVKIPIGIDRRYAYTKKDVRGLIGDQQLRKSIFLPKPTLGLCLSLVMETNGTVFSAKHLESDKRNAKKISTVFAKAVATRALPRQCVDCECTAPNTGVSYMECYQCTMTNLTRNNIEHHILGFEDEDAFNNMNKF
ncbi:hypothetical protein NQ317_004215 [Molorchus minor]|uniref:VWFD domain-containing protein n=1 Tax=Molorchus minor TaxID=1323400 RepID=A0ABQ9JIW3_9CUCU|nr:hypothetical protein NQ317_004215 [Molorchus minor]